jgi:hypothetical protein
MPDLPFHHPEARRKRAAKIKAETDRTMLAWASSLKTGVTKEPAPPKTGTIYFLGPEGGPIKIGFAKRLSFRLNDLRLMNPFPLIVHASVDGLASLERDYHRQFAAHRLHGEWFSPSPDILAEIERLTEVTIAPPSVRVRHLTLVNQIVGLPSGPKVTRCVAGSIVQHTKGAAGLLLRASGE